MLSLRRAQLISYATVSDKQLQHLTGFSHQLFDYFLLQFRTTCHFVALAVEDELLITLIKYRLNLYYLTLAHLFDVDRRCINKIVICWSKHIYKCLHKINFWKLATNSLTEYTVILDCTEFKIARSSDPIIQQTTYSQILLKPWLVEQKIELPNLFPICMGMQ